VSKRQKQDDTTKEAKVVKGKGSRSWSPKAGKNRTAEGRTRSARKQARIDAQREREAVNVLKRRNGQMTPWEEAKAARKARRAAMGLPKQERYNGRIIKRDEDGNKVLVQCCRRCDREAEVAAAREAEAAKAAGARKVRANDQRQKAAAAARKIHPAPKQIHPKEN
jgi:hypothetical protein